jgi:hypothetical protein
VREQKERESPGALARRLTGSHELARVYQDYLARVRGTEGLADTLDRLRPTTASLLMATRTPAAVRDSLLWSLARLDLVDALAEALGQPPAIGVQKLLFPSVEVSIRIGGSAPPATPGRSREVFPCGRSRTVGLFRRGDGVERAATNPAMVLLLSRKRFETRDPVEELVLGDAGAAGPGGRRLMLYLTGMTAQAALWIWPAGLRAAIPVRAPPGSRFSPGTHVWFTVDLRGALAGADGGWRVTMLRASEDAARLYVIIDSVWSEPLP